MLSLCASLRQVCAAFLAGPSPMPQPVLRSSLPVSAPLMGVQPGGGMSFASRAWGLARGNEEVKPETVSCGPLGEDECAYPLSRQRPIVFLVRLPELCAGAWRFAMRRAAPSSGPRV
jgi:hypothetical protein